MKTNDREGGDRLLSFPKPYRSADLSAIKEPETPNTLVFYDESGTPITAGDRVQYSSLKIGTIQKFTYKEDYIRVSVGNVQTGRESITVSRSVLDPAIVLKEEDTLKLAAIGADSPIKCTLQAWIDKGFVDLLVDAVYPVYDITISRSVWGVTFQKTSGPSLRFAVKKVIPSWKGFFPGDRIAASLHRGTISTILSDGTAIIGVGNRTTSIFLKTCHRFENTKNFKGFAAYDYVSHKDFHTRGRLVQVFTDGYAILKTSFWTSQLIKLANYRCSKQIKQTDGFAVGDRVTDQFGRIGTLTHLYSDGMAWISLGYFHSTKAKLSQWSCIRRCKKYAGFRLGAMVFDGFVSGKITEMYSDGTAWISLSWLNSRKVDLTKCRMQ